jgi:NO-binding membrane sensor protein with MHYT domain
MSERLSRLKEIGGALMRRTWPQVLTMIVFTVAISLRFPLWFVMLSAIVNGAAVAYLAKCFASRPSGPAFDPLLGAILIGSGLASIALTLKWWAVE